MSLTTPFFSIDFIPDKVKFKRNKAHEKEILEWTTVTKTLKWTIAKCYQRRYLKRLVLKGGTQVKTPFVFIYYPISDESSIWDQKYFKDS